MKVYLASDHAGFELKDFLVTKLKQSHPNIDFIDLGTNSDSSVDYPDYAHELSSKVLTSENSKGILLCGSGIGMSITANRYKGIRAALAMNEELASLSRKHNNSNVLVLAARFLNKDDAFKISKQWLDTEFEAGRHLTRIEKIERC